MKFCILYFSLVILVDVVIGMDLDHKSHKLDGLTLPKEEAIAIPFKYQLVTNPILYTNFLTSFNTLFNYFGMHCILKPNRLGFFPQLYCTARNFQTNEERAENIKCREKICDNQIVDDVIEEHGIAETFKKVPAVEFFKIHDKVPFSLVIRKKVCKILGFCPKHLQNLMQWKEKRNKYSSENMKKLQLCDENRWMLLNIAVSMDKLVEDIFGPYFILDMFERIDLKNAFKDTGTLKAFDIESALTEYVRYDNLMYRRFLWFLLILFHIICNLTIIEDFIFEGFEDYEDPEDYEHYENLH